MSSPSTSLEINTLTGTHRVQRPESDDPRHPWPVEACRKMAYVSIGTWKIRTIYSRRNDWWDRLRAAATPEEKLTCERMINAFGEALGLHQHELGAKIAAQNPYLDADFGSRAEDLEKRAVDKWR